MIPKVKCWHCNYVFNPENAPMKSELVDSGPGYAYYQDYPVCPECGCDELDDFTQLDEDCDGIDCYGDCEHCEIRDRLDQESEGTDAVD